MSPKKKESPKKTPAKQASTPKSKATTPKQKASSTKKVAAEKKPAPEKTPPTARSGRSRRGRGAEETVEATSEEKTETEAATEVSNLLVENAGEPKTAQTNAEEKMNVEEGISDEVCALNPEDDAAAGEKMTAEDEDAGDNDNVEQDQTEEVTQAAEAERADTKEEAGVLEYLADGSTPDEPVKDKETKESIENPIENEQVESDEKENESAECELVETAQGETSDEPEIIAIEDSSKNEKSQDNVIDLDDDSGDAVIIGEETEGGGSGDSTSAGKTVTDVEPILVEDDIQQVNGTEGAVDGDALLSQNEGKRKIDEVLDGEEVEDTKKARVEDQKLENGEADQDVVKDFVVVEMDDVPKADSEDVQKSLPSAVTSTSNNTEQTDSVNPVLNRNFIPNPAFSSSTDISKQFSLVSYNMLADCHLLRNNYTYTDAKYLKPEYRLTNVIEELKYLDGDVVCLQEVDPGFYNDQLLPVMRG